MLTLLSNLLSFQEEESESFYLISQKVLKKVSIGVYPVDSSETFLLVPHQSFTLSYELYLNT